MVRLKNLSMRDELFRKLFVRARLARMSVIETAGLLLEYALIDFDTAATKELFPLAPTGESNVVPQCERVADKRQLSAEQINRMFFLYDSDKATIVELAERFNVASSTVRRYLATRKNHPVHTRVPTPSSTKSADKSARW